MADFLARRNTPCLALDTWLLEEWHRYKEKFTSSHSTLLSTWQSLVLFENIIRHTSEGANLFKAPAIATLAFDAWELCRKWNLNFEAETEDQAAFIKWSAAYQARCEASSWLDRASIIDVLMEAYQRGEYVFPKEISCIGFESLSIYPQLDVFLSKAQESGSIIHHRSLLSSKRGDVKRIKVDNVEEEILLAATVAAHWQQNAPHSRIAIVVPDLAACRKAVVRIFKENMDEAHFNIAAPISFINYPMIEAALLALRLFSPQLSLDDVSLFLRSPFFKGGMTENLSRATLEADLRKQGGETLSLVYLSGLPLMTKYLNPCLEILPTLKEKQLSTKWGHCIQTILESLGWPGDRALNSDETQQYEKWQSLLLAYQEAASVLGEHSFAEALTHLRHLLKETVFLPKAINQHAPIQVLGLLEGLGLPFDYLWVMGLHQQSWPEGPKPNPLIPLSLQKKLGLPRSSSKREYLFAIDATERLCKAPVVIFSQASSVLDEPREESPLLTAFPLVSIEALDIPSLKSSFQKQSGPEKMLIASELHNFEESAPGLGRDEKLSLGAHTLKLQTLCPFRAFAETRLRAKPLEKVAIGLRANERGDIVHQILCAFWEDVKDKAGLEGQSQDAHNI